jgi:transcription elongation factor Elf1
MQSLAVLRVLARMTRGRPSVYHQSREQLRMKCPNCQTRELVVIEMVVSGEPVALHSCSSCDLRWWETRDGLLSLARVLDLATTR